MLYLNKRQVQIESFPNGETLIKTKQLYITSIDDNIIEMKFENDLDIMNLIFLKKHLDNLGVTTNLISKYLPYSRMDRTEGITIFTLKYICEIINKLSFKEVMIYEPHSDVCVFGLNKLIVVNKSSQITNQLMKDLNFGNNDYLFYPDTGACKRYSKEINYNRVLTGNKNRDFTTGKITKLNIEGELPINPFRVIIVDDLCSKGGTFMLSAEKLKELGATEIYLVVTHCENTIFDGDILKTDLIKQIYTTDSILTKEHSKIKIIY